MMDFNDPMGRNNQEPENGSQNPQNNSAANNTGWTDGQNYAAGGAQPGWNNQDPQQNPSQDSYDWKFENYDSAAGYTDPSREPQKPKKPGKNKGLKVFAGILGGVLALCVLAFSGFGIYSAFFLHSDFGQQETASSADASTKGDYPSLNVQQTPESNEAPSEDGKLSAREVGKKVKPSVVGIVQYQYGSGDIRPSGEGSGIIMTEDGYIITNAHVIQGASGIKVVLNNGEEYEARVIGSDVRTDLAVIKIEAKNLTAAEFGQSGKMEEGDIVWAIGNPGGLVFAGSITQGIISGVDRQISSEYGTTVVLQTDAAINPGNSGGALVNEYGQVIGINSAKISATEYEGIGFAIPIDDAKPIVEDLIQHGRVTGRVVLGIYNAQPIDEIAARVYGVPTGLMVGGLHPDSDIAKKGVVTGDIITKINDTNIGTAADVYNALKDFKVGDSVKLTVFRRTTGHADKTFEVTVALMEDSGTAAPPPQTLPSGQKTEGLNPGWNPFRK